MADRYVAQTGSNTSPYDTWAKAATTLASAISGSAAGDRFFLDSAGAETGLSGNITYTFPGTVSSPSIVMSVNRSGDPQPPTTPARGYQLVTTGEMYVGGYAYIYGLDLQVGNGVSTLQFLRLGDATTSTNVVQVWEDCDFSLLTTNANGRIDCRIDGAQRGVVHLLNPRLRFSAAGQAMFLNSETYIRGGSRLGVGGSTPTGSGVGMFSINQVKRADIYGFDASGWASTLNLMRGQQNAGIVRFRGIKMPSGWAANSVGTSGALVALTASGNAEVDFNRTEAFGISDGDVNGFVMVHDKYGDLKTEVTLVKTGGATRDGTNASSWKVVTHDGSNLNAAAPVFPVQHFRTPPLRYFNTTLGSAITLTVDILHDSVTNLQDDDIWLEVRHPGNAGFPLIKNEQNRVSPIGTAADHASSSATWTSTGMANPNKQKLEISVTPQEVCDIEVVLCVAKPNYTVYIDHELQLSGISTGDSYLSGDAMVSPGAGAGGGGMKMVGTGGLAG